MPELPEVETVRRTLLPHVLGQRIEAVQVHQASLREPVDTQRLQRALPGQCVLQVRRRAKYLLFDLSAADVLLVHLGMSGRLGVVARSRPLRKHDHVVLQLQGEVDLRLNDARRFGMVASFGAAQEAEHPRLRHLGVEPLDPLLFTGRSLHAATRQSQRSIKTFLMDATEQVGVGNIYACEALFAAGINPKVAAGRLSVQRCLALVAAVQAVLKDAIDKGGTTLRDFANVEGDAGLFAPNLQVYGRTAAACRRCDGFIVRLVQAGRSTFYCRRCQH
jgi:formamidopyrimidine-DNA glycosylase